MGLRVLYIVLLETGPGHMNRSRYKCPEIQKNLGFLHLFVIQMRNLEHSAAVGKKKSERCRRQKCPQTGGVVAGEERELAGGNIPLYGVCYCFGTFSHPADLSIMVRDES